MELLAPNGGYSKLTPEQYKLVRTPAFKSWFGDWETAYETKNYDNVSKVIGYNMKGFSGEPIICSHISYDKFNVFRTPSFFQEGEDGGAYGDSSDEELVNYNVFLSIKNPLELRGAVLRDKFIPLISEIFKNAGISEEDFNSRIEFAEKYSDAWGLFKLFEKPYWKGEYGYYWEWIFDYCKKNNYDGFVMNDSDKTISYTITTWVALENNQIKLADGTNTTFDSNNPDIRYEIGGIFQGTPHEFDRYSTEYMGTGEGNQVFGWGLYFTDVKDIARYYMSAGLYDDEQKIMLNGKSLSKYKIQQEVKDQLVGIVDTIFGEDKMIPTINSIKDYLVLEYDAENYPELKEIVELSNKTYNFIKDKKLSFIGNIYSVTLFKGKNPDEYDLLEWEQKPTEIQILKIKNQAKKEGVDLSKLPFDLERYRDSNAIYTDLSYIISGVSHLKNRDSGKMCSEFLLRAGFDGIRYKAGTLSGFEDEEGYNYVIFDANDVIIEGKEKYDEILAGNEKYADGGELTISSEQVENKLGRKLHWWKDDIVYLSGIKYKKVYLRPEYKKVIE